MMSNQPEKAFRNTSRTGFLLVRLGFAVVFGAGAMALAGCTEGNGSSGSGATGGTGGAGGDTTTGTGGTGGGGAKVGKVDILVSVDNSRSMADKQQILSLALDDLLSGLASPPCLDANGQFVSQPGGLDVCPEGSSRQYQPVRDIHIGIVSSSLGGHGSDACSADGAGKASNNDRGHLLDRLDPVSGGTVPTYQNKGFLAWDPTQQMSPPGESNPLTLGQHFSDMVLGVGQVGCGYESQLESVYRFLVDPTPYETITLDEKGMAAPQGIDQELLEQRKAFLRPDSMLIVLSLSDENDCSTREHGQFYYSNQQKSGNGSAFRLPRARAVCETNPNDQCCFSCGQNGPKDSNGNNLCAVDPTCKDADGTTLYHDELTDNINLRCFDQKRRFGIDFLYPVERYVDAFTSQTVTDKNGQVVANPIFSDLDPSDGVSTIRDPGLVVFAGLVGVPWQDIARNPGDLKQGFKTAAELAQDNASGQNTWDIVLGDPANDVKPLDPFMLESTAARSGVNPVTGTATTAPGGALNPINGSEHTIDEQDDLQYVCTIPITQPYDCSSGSFASCDCQDPQNDSPLCENNPATGTPTLQVRAKAYPGLRQLSFLKGLGDQAVVGSICASQITDPTQGDYAYRPVVASLLARVKSRLE